MTLARFIFISACGFASIARAAPTTQPLAIKAETIHTMSGAMIKDGVILCRDGKIESVGRAADVTIPEGTKTLSAKVVTPGLIDAHTIVGLQGYLNEPREQDQLDKSSPIQPELRALDAFNGREKLLEWVRGFGVTTIHTGPEPGALVTGQTMIIKTRGPTVDDGLIRPTAMLSIALGDAALSEDRSKSPGTRPKELAMLRAELVKAREYDRKRSSTTQRSTTGSSEDKTPSRDLREEIFVRVLKREMPVLITAHRARDIDAALKLANEFELHLILDGASEAYLMIDQIKAAKVPVILHPTMFRSSGDAENLSMETAAKLHDAGIAIALQSAYEGYVPKTRVVLFEAALAASNGLKFEDALATITIDAAKILRIEDRVGSIEKGKDADFALFDGDPFEYTSHCIGTVIDGQVVSDKPK